MLLRSIIIDDEETGIETLKFLIEKYVPDVKVVAQTTIASNAVDLIENYRPEIVFLDISMPEMDGFEMLEKLSWKKFNLIFTTAHQEYGLKALKTNAIDYLLKPIDYKDLQLAVDKIKDNMLTQDKIADDLSYIALSKLNPHLITKLAISSKHGVEYIDPAEIILLESKSNYTLVYLNNKTILTPKTLKDFEILLCESGTNFIRVHHSFIINLRKVLRFLKNEDNIVMINDQVVPLAKSKRDTFFEWMKL